MENSYALNLNGYERVYRLYRTNAPKAYDGFGTLELYSGGDWRHVLINVDNEVWQTGRYGSGMHVAENETLTKSLKNWITDKLYERISKVEFK